jgi:hypothetical protein
MAPQEIAEREGLVGRKGLVETPRLYLERLSAEKHIEGFHELWTSSEAMIWSYVSHHLFLPFSSHVILLFNV